VAFLDKVEKGCSVRQATGDKKNTARALCKLDN
jgi:hypothetical protein